QEPALAGGAERPQRAERDHLHGEVVEASSSAHLRLAEVVAGRHLATLDLAAAVGLRELRGEIDAAVDEVARPLVRAVVGKRRPVGELAGPAGRGDVALDGAVIAG